MNKYLVTGAGGSIGSAIMELIGESGIAVDHNEKNLFDLDHGRAIVGDINKPTFIAKYQPDTVIHCAAYKHIPYAEENVSTVVDNNVNGTRKLLEACEASKVKRFLFISTDKAAQPCSVMGLTKAIGEKMVMASRIEKKICLRFGNIYGSSGSVVEIFKRQFDEGKPVTVTHKDCMRYFMDVETAVRLVLGALDLSSGIYALNCGEPSSIDALARSVTENVEYIGLRPGEKLTETFLNVNEKFEDETVTYRKVCLIE